MNTTEQNLQSAELASRLSGLDAKWLQPFETEDPFNDNLRLTGFLSIKPDHRYGALVLTQVDSVPVPQLILATPKLHYPFGKDGKFHFPPIKKIHLYEKLDGTNILAYGYYDGTGRQRLTYKLRLAPILKNSRWGPFLDMWQELLQRYPDISRLVSANRCQVSFEMYGSRNTHLVVYEPALAVAVLFGVRADASIVAPTQLETFDVPQAPWLGDISADQDPVARYAGIRAEMEQRNRLTDDEKLVGMEGTVWYVEEPDGRFSMWKCKPESVEAIHWAVGINKKAVIATCWNFLETRDDLNYDSLFPMLHEDYNQKEIESFRAKIDECIRYVLHEFEFRENVLSAYDQLGLSIQTAKDTVMRALAPQFQRQEMKKVYTMIIRNR